MTEDKFYVFLGDLFRSTEELGAEDTLNKMVDMIKKCPGDIKVARLMIEDSDGVMREASWGYK